MHSTPSMTPMPVMTLAPTGKAVPHAASGDSSRNGESRSTSSSMPLAGQQLAAPVVALDVLSARHRPGEVELRLELGEVGEHRLAVDVALGAAPVERVGQDGHRASVVRAGEPRLT
jgi:hypothetical protein